jgi:hypothetical protein
VTTNLPGGTLSRSPRSPASVICTHTPRPHACEKRRGPGAGASEARHQEPVARVPERAAGFETSQGASGVSLRLRRCHLPAGHGGGWISQRHRDCDALKRGTTCDGEVSVEGSDIGLPGTQGFHKMELGFAEGLARGHAFPLVSQRTRQARSWVARASREKTWFSRCIS